MARIIWFALCALFASSALADDGVKLFPPPDSLGGNGHPQFGRALGLSGRVLAVGAPYAHGGAGRVFLYCGDDFTMSGRLEMMAPEG